MSKQNPNQEYYKTGGRSQSDGPDRLHTNEHPAKLQPAEEPFNKDPNHPVIRRAKKK